MSLIQLRTALSPISDRATFEVFPVDERVSIIHRLSEACATGSTMAAPLNDQLAKPGLQPGRAFCSRCNDYSQRFCGESEPRRHVDRVHSAQIKWVIVEPS